jgi:hypothetical protein
MDFAATVSMKMAAQQAISTTNGKQLIKVV